jgi:hypothetical protein
MARSESSESQRMALRLATSVRLRSRCCTAPAAAAWVAGFRGRAPSAARRATRDSTATAGPPRGLVRGQLDLDRKGLALDAGRVGAAGARRRSIPMDLLVSGRRPRAVLAHDVARCRGERHRCASATGRRETTAGCTLNLLRAASFTRQGWGLATAFRHSSQRSNSPRPTKPTTWLSCITGS